MSRKKCRRKVRPLVLDLIGYVKKGVAMVDGKLLADLRELDAYTLAVFKEDRANLDDYRRAVDAMNLAEYMGRRGVGPEALEACDRLHRELLDAARRFEKNGRMSLTSAGLVALQDVYEYHDLQRQCVDHATLERYIDGLKKHIRCAGRGVVKLDIEAKDAA